MNISKFIEELKRRNVFKVAVAYAIAGWLIIQIVTVIEKPLNIPDWFDTIVIVVVGIGFPLTLIFAWAFELTPEGIKKSQEVDITESVTNRTGKKLNGLIISVLSIALFFVVVERIFFAKASILEDAELSAEIETASIAVLPFVNMSSDTENEYFSDGLSEELLNALAKVEDLKVTGRTSSFQFKGTNPDLREVGEQLGVKYILEGSVRKSGNQVRITAQLIKADDGFHVWTEAYDRELTASSIFGIQEEISRHVMEELKVRLLPQEEVQLAQYPTQDIEAYNAFLFATQIEVSRRPDDLERAIEKYKTAIRLDPTFAEAYARLSMAYIYLHSNGNLALDEAVALAKANVDKALEVNSNLGRGYQALGVYYSLTQDLEKAEQALKKAVELMPNDATARYNYRGALNRNSKLEQGLEEFFKAYELDPLNPQIANSYVFHLLQVENKYEEASVLIDQIIARNPDFNGAYYSKAWLLRDVPYGELDNAFKFAYEAYKRNPDDLDFMWMLSSIAMDVDLLPVSRYFADRMEAVYPENNAGPRNRLKIELTEGNFEEADQIIEELINKYGARTIDFFIIEKSAIYYHRGEYQKAIDLFENWQSEFLSNPESAIENKDQQTVSIFYMALQDKLGNEETYQTFATKICNYQDKKLSELAQTGKTELYNELDLKLTCQIASREYEDAIATIEQFHFELNSKANWPMILASEIQFYPLRESPAYEPFIEKLFDDLHGMRANIIEYLKAEGEWKEEWEVRN